MSSNAPTPEPQVASINPGKASVKDLFNAMDKGLDDLSDSDSWKEWLNFQSKFWNYSFQNSILIISQCPHATRVAGAKKWKRQFGRSLKSGQYNRKIWIWAPNFRWIPKKDDNGDVVVDDNGDVVKVKTLIGFIPVWVYDVSQTYGKPLPQICKDLEGDSNGLLESLLLFAADINVPVDFEDFPGKAKGFYSPQQHRIVVRKSLSDAAQAHTLAHELAHSILHSKDAKKEEMVNRADGELEAESVAYIVCEYFGLPTNGTSFEYVASWKGDEGRKVLKEHAERISKTAKQIIGFCSGK